MLLLPLLAFFVACEYGIDITPAGSILPNTLTVRAAGNNQGSGGAQAGVVTAAEWNDLDNWTFGIDRSTTLFTTPIRLTGSFTQASCRHTDQPWSKSRHKCSFGIEKAEYSVWKARTDNRVERKCGYRCFKKPKEFR